MNKIKQVINDILFYFFRGGRKNQKKKFTEMELTSYYTKIISSST